MYDLGQKYYGVRTHDLQIMTTFHVTETPALTTRPSVTSMSDVQRVFTLWIKFPTVLTRAKSQKNYFFSYILATCYPGAFMKTGDFVYSKVFSNYSRIGEKYLLLFRLKVKYGDHVESRGFSTGDGHSCALAPGERITSLAAYIDMYLGSYKSVGGVSFTTTTRKICGPFGVVTSDVHLMRGHMLLYFTGRSVEAFDELVPVFDYCYEVDENGEGTGAFDIDDDIDKGDE